MIANGAAFVRLCFLSPMIIEGLATGKFTRLSINKMIPVTTPI